MLKSMIFGPNYKVNMLINQNGFSLIGLAVVLLIVGILSVGGVGLLSGLTKRKQYSDTRTSLDLVNVARTNFVSRVGRLPCPADSAGSAGLEVRTAAGSGTAQTTGVAPWLSVGLSEAMKPLTQRTSSSAGQKSGAS